MSADLHVTFSKFPAFARAMKIASQEYLTPEVGRALFRIGKSDIDKMKADQLSGGSLNIRSKKFRNSFKFRATDSRQAKNVEQLFLSEYTGAKPFKIFQDGGEITPNKSRTLTILTDAARSGGGTRKISQKELKTMIETGQASIIKTKAGPAVVLNSGQLTKTGKVKRNAKSVILAWLKPRVVERQRIDFFGNFQSNASAHETFLNEAAQRAIDKTIEEDDEEEEL